MIESNKYKVKKIEQALNGTVIVPGSKSMTNRALLLAALSNESVRLSGVLFSDDSRHFLDCLISLGFELNIDEVEKKVDIKGCDGSIPKKEAEINVGSAGTAARFLTAMLALSDGNYTINCSEQMKRRPMDELFRVLTDMGAEFEYLDKPMHLPVKVKGNGGICKDIDMDISKSTQYLSAMLMVTPVTESGITINITSSKKTGAYIKITMEMLEEFGVNVQFDGEKYIVNGKQNLVIGDYYIEPDVSAACYFYGIAALTGGKIIVKNVFNNSKQGDLKFLNVLEKMGCNVSEGEIGICVSGNNNAKLKSVDIDMNDFSDQALTLAALAPFLDGTTIIRNIGHIRGQECDRMQAIYNELSKCGIECVIDGNDIMIKSGEVKPAEIETYDDHRVAMAFTLMGLKTEGIVINNPSCCKKTFENYYEVLEKLISDNKVEE